MKFIGSGFEHLSEFFSSLIIWELMSFFAFMIEDINKKLKDNVEDNSLATVANTGSYKDLTYKPVIPTVPRKVSSFQNDSEYLTQSDIAGKADKATTYTKTEVDALLVNVADDDEPLSILDIWNVVKTDIEN